MIKLILWILFTGGMLYVPHDHRPTQTKSPLLDKRWHHQTKYPYSDSLVEYTARVVFYNVENLFHPSDDSLKDDDDFTPRGDYHWTYERYYEKIRKLGKLFVAIGEGRMPALIGLCEIENRRVLNDLLTRSVLQYGDYKIIHKDSPDVRGIDVALLYDAHAFHPLKFDFLSPGPDVSPGLVTRDILYLLGSFNGGNLCHIFVNHWPSRRGGKLESEEKRVAVSMMLHYYIDSLVHQDGQSNILIMGDFNDEPSDLSLSEILGAKDPEKDKYGLLYNLMYPHLKRGKGTHFRVNTINEASVLDQIIISKAVWEGKNGIALPDEKAVIFQNSLLFGKKIGRPLRTYQGLKYLGGFSDHLPVYVDLLIDSSK